MRGEAQALTNIERRIQKVYKNFFFLPSCRDFFNFFEVMDWFDKVPWVFSMYFGSKAY
jgi:hypothetical protein